MTSDVGYPDQGLGHAQKFDRVKSVNGIQTLPLLKLDFQWQCLFFYISQMELHSL